MDTIIADRWLCPMPANTVIETTPIDRCNEIKVNVCISVWRGCVCVCGYEALDAQCTVHTEQFHT